jgi:hypothetical protein
MSQVGTIVSVSPVLWAQQWNWSVMFTYQLDAGGTQTAQVFVGTPQTPQAAVLGSNPYATVAPWSSPTSTITVPTNPPGTSVPVVLPCPPLIQTAMFNVPLK